MNNEPLAENLVIPENLERLRGIPIFLFCGGDSKVLTPESTDLTYSILRDRFGVDGYEREVVPGYGHLDVWMGTRAVKDVYPMVRRRVDGIVRGRQFIGT